MIKRNKLRERRHADQLVLLERRKGKTWMHAQMVLCVALVAWLVWLVY